MATLILTAVGTAIGGPLGGALGALIGQSADAALFGPKARSGPRLSDLKVQTSSYGDIVPRLYGRMRVAGSVIWSTDLIERRAKKSNGKGRPKSIEYSYSASFAVALSSRPIAAIRRIWADGRILRDSNGSFAEDCQFRSFTGSEDQSADPLIASALGTAQCSAFRGIAYAMFEELDLTAFGNRIPQLSFEIEADLAPVSAGAVGGDLLRIDTADGGPSMVGYAALGERTSDALRPLAQYAVLGLQSHGGELTLAPADWQGDASGDRLALRIDPANPAIPGEDSRAPLARVARQIIVRHYDPARDYQTSQQIADVAGGGGPSIPVDLPAALDSDGARNDARRLALASGDARRKIVVQAGYGALTLPVGRAMSFAIGREVPALWRIAERVVGPKAVEITMVRHAARADATAMAGDGGEAVTTAALPSGEATMVVLDMPGDGETARNAPLRVVAAAGIDSQWRGADLSWVSSANADPEPIGRILPSSGFGVLALPMAAAPTWLVDWANPVEVILANDAMALVNVSMARLLARENLAMIGSEVVQFMRASPLGQRRWRLQGLLRARGGTDDVETAHLAGTHFVMLNDAALVTLPDETGWLASATSAAIDWRARGALDLQRLTVPAGNRAIVPLSPVHGRANRQGDGSVRIGWTARSRSGARWRDAVDAPAGESQQRWRLRWPRPGGQLAELIVEANGYDIAAGDYAAGADLTVAQLGDYAVSPVLHIQLP